MRRSEVSDCVRWVCSCLRLSQAKTLSVLVPAAMMMVRASLAQLGQRHLLRNVVYRKHRPAIQQVAVVWLPDQAEPWYLMTDEEHLRAQVLSKVFARRMSIEEYFRDVKSQRNGFALRLILIKASQRLSRFLLILALAYLLLVTMELYASERFRPGPWGSNNRPGECSLFTIGLFMRTYPLPTCKYLLRQLKHEVLQQNRG